MAGNVSPQQSHSPFQIPVPLAGASGFLAGDGGQGARKWVAKTAWPQPTVWAAPGVLPGWHCGRPGPGLLLFSLLAGMSHHDRQPGKAPSVSQQGVRSATPPDLPSWATHTLQGGKDSTPWVGRDRRKCGHGGWPGVNIIL